MSSILEALKKAEQESNMERSAGTPWSAPPSMQPSYREGRRRWWVPLGIAAGLCVVGVVLWQVRQPRMTRPVDSMSALPSQPLPKPYHGVVPPVVEASNPRVPVAEKVQTPPDKTLVDASPRQATDDAPVSSGQTSGGIAVATPVQPEMQPLPDDAPTAASSLQPTPSQQAQPLRQTADPTPLPVVSPTDDPASRPAETAAASQPPAAPKTDKRFRSDPRIDLQALVWAPESAARFVVINNRLIKEGGSVDNILVVRINPDDVLLAEGSDRWHEAFKIR